MEEALCVDYVERLRPHGLDRPELERSFFRVALMSIYNNLTGLRWLRKCFRSCEGWVEAGPGSWARCDRALRSKWIGRRIFCWASRFDFPNAKTPSAPLSRLCRITSEIILSFVPKQGSIYGPIRFARALMIACGKETRAYIRPHTWKMFHLPGPDGICASSPNQVNGLERPRSPQVLKKLVSPLSPSCLAQASRLDTSTTAQKIYTAGRYTCCFAIRDQRMRAFLLASATQALAVPSLCCLSLIHRLRQSVLALAR